MFPVFEAFHPNWSFRFVAMVALNCALAVAVQGSEERLITELEHEVTSWNASFWTAYSSDREQHDILELCRQLWAYALDIALDHVTLTSQQTELIEIDGILRKNARLFHHTYSVVATSGGLVNVTAAKNTFQETLTRTANLMQVDLGLSVSAWSNASRERSTDNIHSSSNSTNVTYFLDHYRPQWRTLALFDITHINVSAAGVNAGSTDMPNKVNDSEVTEARVVQVLHGVVLVYNISRNDAVTKNLSTVIGNATQLVFDEGEPFRKDIVDVKVTFGYLQTLRSPAGSSPVNESDIRYRLTFTLIVTVQVGSATRTDKQLATSRTVSSELQKSLREGLARHASNITASTGWIWSFEFPGIEADDFVSVAHRNCQAIPYVLFDCVNLAYGSDRVPTSALGALLNIWTLVLGRNVSNINLALSKVSSEVSFSLAGDHGLPINKLYLRVTFTSAPDPCPPATNYSWNTLELKKTFRENVLQARHDLLLLSNTELLDLSFYNDALSRTQPAPEKAVAVGQSPSTTTSSTITTTANSAETNSIQENIVLCYPNETERNRQLASLRQIWADAFGQDIFDVRLSVTHDVLVSKDNSTSAQPGDLSLPTVLANSSSTNDTTKPLSIHKVQYIVIPAALDVHRLNLSSARSRYYDLLANSSLGQLQENCSALAGNILIETNITSTTSPPFDKDLQISPPKIGRQMALSIVNESTVLQYDNLAEKKYALDTIRLLWASAFNYSVDRTSLKIANEVMLGPSVHQIDYTIILKGHSGTYMDLPAVETIEAAKQYFGQFFPKPTTTTPATAIPTTTPEPVKVAKPYLFYDHLRLTYRDISERDGALSVFQTIWQKLFKLACEDCTSRMVVYDENPVYVPPDASVSTTADTPNLATVPLKSDKNYDNDIGETHTIFYVVIVVSMLPNIDFVRAKEDFRQTVFNASDFNYIVNFANVYPSPKPRPIQTVVFLRPASPSIPINSSRLELKTLGYQKLLGHDFVWLDVWNVRFPANTVYTRSPLEHLPSVLADTFEITALITTNMRISSTELQNAV